MPTPSLHRLAPALAVAGAFAGALALAACSGAGGPDAAPGELETPQARASYGIGLRLGQNLSNQGVEVDPDQVAQGLRDALEGREPRLDDAAIDEALTALQQETNARMAEERAAEAEDHRADGAAFLEENAARDGVTVLPSGLQYEVLEPGDGPSPDANDRVTIHYTGTLIDGSEFDSSRGGDPATFSLDGVIPGFREGLQQVREGATCKLYVPGDMGYGDTPPPGEIPPGATLVFEVELLEVTPVE